LIGAPVGKQKSVVFSDEGLREAERCFRKLFAKGERTRLPYRRLLRCPGPTKRSRERRTDSP